MTGNDGINYTSVWETSRCSSLNERQTEYDLRPRPHPDRSSDDATGWQPGPVSEMSEPAYVEEWERDFDTISPSEERDSLLRQSSPRPDGFGSGTAPSDEEAQEPAPKRQTASWRELPRKGQLGLLMISRLSEPLTQTSLQSYMFYQLRSFDTNLSDAAVAKQVGWMAAGFTAAQFCTAFAWGRVADSEVFGRKKVILIGLLGTTISAVGFGFSKSYASAIFFRCVGGALNGNVGVMKVMISEIIKEKRFQSRAFMMLPMTFNIGVIIGPMLGGILSDPIHQYPSIFGPGSTIGGQSGVWWMRRWPFALPNLVSAVFLLISSLALFLGLEETHERLRQKPDLGVRIGKWITRCVVRRRQDRVNYTAVPTDDHRNESANDNHIELQPAAEFVEKPPPRGRLAFRRIWTRNVVLTLAAHGLLASHVGTFNNLWFTLLSTARFDPAHPYPRNHEHQSLPFSFSGGLSMPPAKIGLALSILGSIGITLQLLLYPKLSAALGTARSYRWSLSLFPLAYSLAPYLALVPSTTRPPHSATGLLVWLAIATVLFVQVLGRTFALPGATILVNNSCPHPSVLGTIHGMAQSVSSGMRTIGPAVAGMLYGKGLEWGVVGTAWWCMAAVAVLGLCVAQFVSEGDGHEILLDDEVRGEDGEVRRKC